MTPRPNHCGQALRRRHGGSGRLGLGMVELNIERAGRVKTSGAGKIGHYGTR
jgi:hypothetical protein